MTLRTFEPGLLALSPDGKQVAYVLREPNLETNVNDMVLYVVSLDDAGKTVLSHNPGVKGKGRELFRTTGDMVNKPVLQWLGDSSGILVLHRPAADANRVISRIDVSGGRTSIVYQGRMDVRSFAASASGERLAITGPVPLEGGQRPRRFESKRGVVMTPEDHPIGVGQMRLMADAEQHTVQVQVIEPVSGGSLTVYQSEVTSGDAWPLQISLSLDGRHLTLVKDVNSREYPAAWRNDPLLQYATGTAPATWLTSVPERLPRQGSTSAAPAFRLAYGAPYVDKLRWSDDGSAYLIHGPKLVDAGATFDGETYETRARPHLYAVDVRNGATSLVLAAAKERAESVEDVVSFDEQGSRVVVKLENGEIVTLRRQAGATGGESWAEESRVSTDAAGYRKGEATTVGNEHRIVGVSQDLMVAPELYVFDIATKRKTILTEINPELRSQRLGKVEKLEWEDAGREHGGYIVYPVDYEPGRRYPAAILCKSWDASFVHAGQVYSSNFPPQALAGANVLVFMLAREQGPEGFRSAKQRLEARGLIDPARVGVMGFSFTSYSIDYLISHPEKTAAPEWAAAISADGGLYSYAATITGRPKDMLEADPGHGAKPLAPG